MSEGYGKITWWGLTPADDVLPGSSDEDELIPEGSSINVLLIGSGDLRHILRTLTIKHHREKRPLHFYIIESNLELLARHLLFLTLMVEPNDKVGLREKTELYLELYGNVLMRSHTSHYVKDKANELIRMITDPDGLMKQILPFVDVSLLKFKERDMLEGIFKFWRNSDNKTIDIQQHWNGRLRHYLAQRYDSRNGVFDWDYHMKLHEMVPLIQHKEYLNWRETGISFQLRDDAPYETLNPTLISGYIIASGSNGGNRLQGGYWGDIVSSPYISFGSYSDDKEVLKKVNDKFVKNSQEISELNVKAMINLLTFCDVMPSSNASPDDDYIEEVDPTIGPNGPLLDG
jgi:dynein assembly factor 3